MVLVKTPISPSTTQAPSTGDTTLSSPETTADDGPLSPSQQFPPPPPYGHARPLGTAQEQAGRGIFGGVYHDIQEASDTTSLAPNAHQFETDLRSQSGTVPGSVYGQSIFDPYSTMQYSPSRSPNDHRTLAPPPTSARGSVGQQQPQPTPPMELANPGHKNTKGMLFGSDGDRNWSHKFFDCFGDAGTCWLACFCPCMVYASNKRRLEHLTKYDTPEPTRLGGSCGSDCLIHAMLIVLSYGWSMQLGTRAAIRNRYRIRGGGCSDCVAASLCTPCELTQDSRELELEEQSILGASGRATARAQGSHLSLS